MSAFKLHFLHLEDQISYPSKNLTETIFPFKFQNFFSEVKKNVVFIILFKFHAKTSMIKYTYNV